MKALRCWSRRVVLAACLAACGLLVGGCSHKGDSVVVTGDGTRLSSDEINRDPLALLPGGAVGLMGVDAQAAFQSEMGDPAVRLFQTAIPLGADANFDVRRDVRRVLIGLYSLQGADVAAVVEGTFDPDAIRTSVANGGAVTTTVPMTRLEYAGNDLFVAGGVGFVVVTKQIMVAGNETGIRRVLDRIRDKRLRRDIPEWMVTTIDNAQAPIAAVGDFGTEPQVAALSQKTPFLQGLTVVRVLGNFQPPGLNVAGSLTYPDAATAEKGAQSLREFGQLASYMNLLALLGMQPPVRDVQVRVEQNDAQFITQIDARGVATLLEIAARSLGR